MSIPTLDDLDLEVENPPRDRWGRPLLVPPDGGERIPYTRASTLANYVADHSALAVWEQQVLAVGLSCRPDLVAMIAALPRLHASERDKKTLTAAEKREDAATKAKLNDYIQQALEAGGKSYKAHHGTAVHGFTDPGADLEMVPERMRPDVDSFMHYVGSGKLEILATEVFVVNEALGAAGSFDHIARFPTALGASKPCILDKKTGSVEGKGLAFAIQLAAYATAEVYDLDTDTRAPLESLTFGEQVSRTFGVIAHIPLGAGRTDFYKVDLLRGIHCARLATNVRSARALKGLSSLLEIA